MRHSGWLVLLEQMLNWYYIGEGSGLDEVIQIAAVLEKDQSPDIELTNISMPGQNVVV